MEDLGITDKPVMVSIGKKEYSIDFTLASIYYLVDKYGDIEKVFSGINGLGTKTIDIICDLIYSGTLQLETKNGKDTLVSPLTAEKIRAGIHFNDIANLTTVLKSSFEKAFSKPEPTQNPTEAATEAASNPSGTGDSFALSGESNSN